MQKKKKVPAKRPFRRPDSRREGAPRRYAAHHKVCTFCVDKIENIDYKEIGKLQRFVSDRGKIEPRRKTGTCARHQGPLTLALKRARYMALLPFSSNQA